MSERALAARGFVVIPDVVPTKCRAGLLGAFGVLVGAAPGNRDGLRDPAVRALASSPETRALVEPILGRSAFAYRATLFDKTPAANWLVAWHQDLLVPVAERRETPGFGPWSKKGSTWFVQPPEEVLRGLLAVRVDFDGSDAQNGALRALPGTHQLGVVPPARIAELASDIEPVTCVVPAGGILLMRPLLLHSSSKAGQATHRRIIHIEYAATELPGGLIFAAHVAAPHGPHRVR